MVLRLGQAVAALRLVQAGRELVVHTFGQTVVEVILKPGKANAQNTTGCVVVGDIWVSRLGREAHSHYRPFIPRPMSFMEVQRSTIVITGVTRGLGRAMVDEFVRLGHMVFGCARTKSGIEELIRIYPEHDFQTVDIASDAQVHAWVERLINEYGPPAFVLNNAAVINVKAPLWEVDSQEFSEEIDTNVKGVTNVIRHFVPSMMARRSGVIVNFVSRWGTKVEAHMAPYCASKWAVVALTRVLSEELKLQGISVVGLNPGIVRTGLLQRYLGEGTGTDMSAYPTPAEWATTAVPYILRLGLSDSGKLRNVFQPSLDSPIYPHVRSEDELCTMNDETEAKR